MQRPYGTGLDCCGFRRIVKAACPVTLKHTYVYLPFMLMIISLVSFHVQSVPAVFFITPRIIFSPSSSWVIVALRPAGTDFPSIIKP